MDDLIKRLLAAGDALSLEAAKRIEDQAIEIRVLADTAAATISEKQRLQVRLINNGLAPS